MIKVALYGLVRVLVEWLGVLPAVVRRARARRSARSRRVGGVIYALFQHDLKRLLALHSIENVGIIVLGLGACLLLRAPRRRRPGPRSRSAPRCCTRVNHAVFKALLFLGAGAFERAVGSLELDRLGGLLRRMPWTGGAFLVGAMAIAGLPPLNGFASEWLTLQALLHVPAYGGVGDGHRRRDRAGRARGDGGARRASASSRSSASCCSARRARAACAAAEEPPLPMRAARRRPRRRLRRARPRARGCSSARSSASRPGPADARRRASGSTCPGTGSLPTVGIAVVARRAHRRRSRSLRGQPQRRARARRWACGQRVEPALALDERRLHEAAAARARGRAAPAARDRPCARAAASCRRSPTRGRVPHLIDDARLPAGRRALSLAAAAHARRLQSGRLGTYVAYLIGARRSCCSLAARLGVDRMSGATVAAGAVQVVGGIAARAAPAGLVQHWKARLQGRRGPAPLQPYRELRRLWGKSARRRRGHDASSTGSRPRSSRRRSRAAVLLVPVAAAAPELGRRPRRARARRAARARALRRRRGRLGHRQRLRAAGREPRPDALGLRRGDARPLARRRGARRRARPTCPASSPARPARDVWSSPALALGAVAFALVVVAETGRQPVDNPDTHLELTMIHEGPLLEYAGRDLALPAVGGGRAALARARARGAGLPPPPARASGGSSPSCPSCSSCSAPALALTETLVAKMRILLVPRLLARRRGGRAARDRHLARGGRRERRPRLGARRARARRRRRPAALGRRRPRHRAGARCSPASRSARRRPATTSSRPRALAAPRRRARGALPRCSSRAPARRGPCARGVAPLARGGRRGRLRARADLAHAADRPRRRATAERGRARARRLRHRHGRDAPGDALPGARDRARRERARARRARSCRAASSLAIELGVALDLTARRARRRRLPRADLRRVRRRRHRAR